YLVVAVEVLGRAVADGARIVAEELVERGNVVRDHRPLVAFERGPHFGHHIGQVDFHVHFRAPFSEGLLAATMAAVSSAWAMRSATSSRQGAAMICTPIGNGSSGTGTATTGRPMNEIGWV